MDSISLKLSSSMDRIPYSDQYPVRPACLFARLTVHPSFNLPLTSTAFHFHLPANETSTTLKSFHVAHTEFLFHVSVYCKSTNFGRYKIWHFSKSSDLSSFGGY